VKDIEIYYGKTNSSAVVEFRSLEKAKLAVNTLNQKPFNNHNVSVCWFRRKLLKGPGIPDRKPDEYFSFNGLTFVVTGTLDRKKLMNIITENKGKVSGILHQRVHYVVADDGAVTRNTQKIRRANTWDKPIVTENFLVDSLKAKKLLDARKYRPRGEKVELQSDFIPSQKELEDPKPQGEPPPPPEDVLIKRFLSNNNGPIKRNVSSSSKIMARAGKRKILMSTRKMKKNAAGGMKCLTDALVENKKVIE